MFTSPKNCNPLYGDQVAHPPDRWLSGGCGVVRGAHLHGIPAEQPVDQFNDARAPGSGSHKVRELLHRRNALATATARPHARRNA